MSPPVSINSQLRKAVAAHQTGMLEQAEKYYLEILGLDPNHKDALRLLGGLYIQWKMPISAISYLKKGLLSSPTQTEILVNLGVACCQVGATDDAINYYKKALQVSPNNIDAHNNLAHIYFELQRYEEALPLLQRALDLNDRNILAIKRIAQILEIQNKIDESITYYEKYTQLNPNEADTLLNLGNLYRISGRLKDACTVYKRIVELCPNNLETRLNYGTLLHDIGKTIDAMQQYDLVLSRSPNSTDALINKAGLYLELEKPEEAIGCYDQVLNTLPQSLDAKWGKSLALLALGKYRDGWKLYETGLVRKNTRGTIPFSKSKLWDGHSFEGKRLLIWGEQGLGDVLQFIRYAALCKKRGDYVAVMCREPLMRLIWNCPFIDNVILSPTEDDFDYHIPVMSLPYIFDTTIETIPNKIPYLYVSQECQNKWNSRFSNIHEYKIGLVWAGNPRHNQIDAHVVDRRRSITLTDLAPLFKLKNVRFYNLQMGQARDQIQKYNHQAHLIDYMSDVNDLMDTAAIIENLDLVISVDTSLVHLAGALGKKVWVLSRFGGCWRWLGNQKLSPWYPTAQVFGQPASYEWTGVVETIYQELERQLMG